MILFSAPRSLIFPVLLVLMMLMPQKASGQDNAIWIGAGIQTSRMDDMKYLQELILDSYPVEGRIVSSFPAYTMASFGFVNQLYPSFRIGAGYGYSASGAKSNYSDYTGYITTLMTASSHRGGGFGSYSVISGEWFELSLFGRIQVKYSLIDVTSTLYSLGASGLTENLYSSWSLGGSAGVEFLIHLDKYSFGVEGGYEVDSPGKLTNRESKNELLDPQDPERVMTSDWSGWFAQVKFMLWLNL